MNAKFKQILEATFRTCGLQLARYPEHFLAPRTERSAVQRLIRTIRPLATSLPLIRLGPPSDGGYLIADDLEGIAACFSPGVSTIAGFEDDCAKRGMTIFLADASVLAPPNQNPAFVFTKKYIGAVADETFLTLSSWVNTCLSSERDSDLLLQMDIEGYEYEVLLSTPEELLCRFRHVIIEFHHLDQLWNQPFFNLTAAAFKKLAKTHICVHAHPNNCCGSYEAEGISIPRAMELTFVRSDRCEVTGFATQFPHPLDCPNVAKADLALPDSWFK